MKRTQDKTTCCLTAAVSLAVVLTASVANAQALPADPWAAQQQVQQPAAPIAGVQTGATSATVVQTQQVGPVVYGSQPYQPTYEGGSDNIWNTKMPEFTGEMTTWGTDYGTQHLRNMGYKIPDTFESRIKAAPSAVRKRIYKAMSDLERANDPFSKGTRFVLDQFEAETGLSYDNLIGNSLDLISKK